MCKYNKKMGDESDIFGGSTEGMAIGLIVLGLFIVLGGGGYWWSSRKPATSTVVVVGAAKTIADVEKKAADMVAEVKTTEAKKITKAEIAEAKTPAQIADAVVKENARLQGIENEKVAKKLIADNAAKKLIDEADGKSCDGSNGVYKYLSGKCVPQSCDVGYDINGLLCTKPKGYCHFDVDNPTFYVLKTTDTPGWKAGDECWAVNGGKTYHGQGDCLFNSGPGCNTLIDSDNNKIVNSLGCYEETYGDRIFSNHIPGSHTVKSCNAYAKKNNHDVFGIQYGDECWMGSKAKKYDKFPNLSCPTPRVGYPYGTGGSFISNVYGTV
jgi:hypothetical protein